MCVLRKCTNNNTNTKMRQEKELTKKAKEILLSFRQSDLECFSLILDSELLDLYYYRTLAASAGGICSFSRGAHQAHTASAGGIL